RYGVRLSLTGYRMPVSSTSAFRLISGLVTWPRSISPCDLHPSGRDEPIGSQRRDHLPTVGLGPIRAARRATGRRASRSLYNERRFGNSSEVSDWREVTRAGCPVLGRPPGNRAQQAGSSA